MVETDKKEDENRIIIVEKKTRHRKQQKDALDIATASGSLLYSAGFDSYVS